MVIAVAILVWVFVLLAGAWLVEWVWVRALGRRLYRFFVAPGIIVHEYSHVAGCWMTGAKVLEIELFKANGGHVRHTKPRWPPIPPKLGPWLGQVVISFAPIVGCLGTLMILAIAMNMRFAPAPAESTDVSAAVRAMVATAPAADASTATSGAAPAAGTEPTAKGTSTEERGLPAIFESLVEQTGNHLNMFWTRLKNLDVAGWVFLYLAMSLIICMAPSGKDFQNSAAGMVLLLVLLLGVGFVVSTKGNATVAVLDRMLPMLAFTLALLVVAIAPTLAIGVPLSRLRGRRR